MNLIGRHQQKKQLAKYVAEDNANFIAVYGRRRVGKTFLIQEYFDNKYTFYCTGLLKGNKKQQLTNFTSSIKVQLQYENETTNIDSWFEAFKLLIEALEKNKNNTTKQVLFIDELPWMDTKGSDFLLGLDFFWNSWASAQKNILFIVCGSSISWIVKNLFNDSGGLYNRITGKIKLEPFTLQECALFFQEKGFKYNEIQCIESYMVFGGIPFYLN
jgi:uncharacterized protein